MCQHCDSLALQSLAVSHGSPAQKFVAEQKKARKVINYQAIKVLVAANPALANANTPYNKADFALAE